MAWCVVALGWASLATEFARGDEAAGLPLPAAVAPPAAATSAAYPGAEPMDAERAKVWNSPAMLRARAWLHEYCASSAKVTPEQAVHYMAELQAMTPSQMKLWLLKFQEQEEMVQQQQAAFNMQRQAGVAHAAQIQQATQQAYGKVNQDESAAAHSAEKSLAAQQQFSQQMGLQKSADRDYAATMNAQPWGMAWANQSPWGPYAGYPMNGPGPYGPAGGGHYHVHYHIAPPAAAVK